jgi:hypothetical protein
MVSLAAIETFASELWPKALSAAAREIDPRKGERVVLVTQQKDATRGEFQIFAKSKGASDLIARASLTSMPRQTRHVSPAAGEDEARPRRNRIPRKPPQR